MKPMILAPAILGAALIVQPAQTAEIVSSHYGALMYGLPLTVAMDRGYFAEEGVDIEGVLSASGGGSAVRTALALDTPYGEAAFGAVIAARQSGLDLVIVNTVLDSLGDASWVVTNDSDYETVAELAGQTITFTRPQSGSELTANMLVESTGLEGVELVASGGMREGLTMVASGAAAAAPAVEPITTMISGDFRVIAYANDHSPEMAQMVAFTTREFADENPDFLRGVIAARQRAVQFIEENPAEAAAIAAAAYDYPPPVLEAAITRLAGEDFWSEGAMSVELFQDTVEILNGFGLLETTEVDWDAAVDFSYLPADLAAQ
jgi:NitT/TauT family transport system substrate-binding protein